MDQAFYDRVAELVGERIKQCGTRVPVITGFFGPIPGSLLRQVGRGYTDLLAALAAVGLEASELQIWKEVDGIFTADPRKVPTARLIPIISPDEAAELTYYGSEVVHPFTMEQVIRRKIPIRIKNVENPTGGGTVIHPDPDSDGVALPEDLLDGLDVTGGNFAVQLERRKKLPTAVTIKERITVLNVHSNRKSVSHGFFARIFGTLDRFGVVVDLISTSEVHVSMAIEDGLGKRMLDRLVKELEKSGTVSAVSSPYPRTRPDWHYFPIKGFYSSRHGHPLACWKTDAQPRRNRRPDVHHACRRERKHRDDQPGRVGDQHILCHRRTRCRESAQLDPPELFAD